MTFNEFMSEQKVADRWLVLKVGLAGMLAGACLAVLFMWLAFL